MGWSRLVQELPSKASYWEKDRAGDWSEGKTEKKA